MKPNKRVEGFVAVASFLVAAVLAIIGQQMSIEGDIKGGTLMMVAQFLTLTATIFGIDYKFGTHDVSSHHNHGSRNNDCSK